MDEEKRLKIVKTIIVIAFIGLPILLMLYDVAIGISFLILGLYSTRRALYYIGNQHLRYDPTNQRHNANAAGKTILVQIVDDFGRELPAKEVEKRLTEARSKANPKDTIVSANFKVNDK